MPSRTTEAPRRFSSEPGRLSWHPTACGVSGAVSEQWLGTRWATCDHAVMPTPAPNGEYAVNTMYSVADDAWYLELDLVADHRTVVMAIVPDEDPAREPTVCFTPAGRHLDIPYEVMRWFMGRVEEEIRTSRAWMRLRPDLVEVIHRLRQEH
jgi:hypothetical protein